jgi:hypothetical protein
MMPRCRGNQIVRRHERIFGLETTTLPAQQKDRSFFDPAFGMCLWLDSVQAILPIGHLEKLISVPIAAPSGANVYKSEREQSRIIRRQFCDARPVGLFFEVPNCLIWRLMQTLATKPIDQPIDLAA